MIKKFSDIKMSGLSLVLPPREISIYDELQYYGNSEKKAERAHKMAGFWKRRVADGDVTAADLGVAAAEKLISSMSLDRSRIEAMLFVVQQPDYGGPCTSYSVHHRLGLSKDCYVTDIVQGCVGWCFGLLSAFQMIASGAYDSVLLVNGDTPAKHLDPSDRINAPLFGDAGVATLVERCEGSPEVVFNLDTFSDGFEALITPGAGARLSFDVRKRSDLDELTATFDTANGRKACMAESYMDGPAVFEFSTQKAPAGIRYLMSHVGKGVDDYDMLFLHQANKQIVQTVGSNAGFPAEKVPYSGFENFGNNTMCSIPSTLLHEKGDLLRSGGSLRALFCAFGNGLVSCAIDMPICGMKFVETSVYERPEGFKTTGEWRTYWREKFINT